MIIEGQAGSPTGKEEMKDTEGTMTDEVIEARLREVGNDAAADLMAAQPISSATTTLELIDDLAEHLHAKANDIASSPRRRTRLQSAAVQAEELLRFVRDEC